MNTWPSIHREGALALAPDDVAEGNNQLDGLIDRAAESIRKPEALQVGFYGFSTVVFVTSCVIYMLAVNRTPPLALASYLALFAGLLSVVMLAVTWWGWTAIQHRRFAKRLGGLSGIIIPDPLQRLIDEFASGVREVRTARGDTVPPRLFASQWAIMLFSHDPRQRLLVRGPRGEKHEPQIFADPDPAQDRSAR